MIELKKVIDTREYLWCRSAALVRVMQGKGVLEHIYTKETDDYTILSSLQLCGRPIMQAKYPLCPTCSALLARGCGIEDVNCAALREIRDRINAPYTGLNTAVLNISPILHLLTDGYYVVADAELYPTDGGSRFFMNVPDKLTNIEASCDCYYDHNFITGVDGFPAYIYPTQSNAALSPERAAYYMDIIDSPDAPRAIAYYDSGFICALLDGHHKAYAAALKGCSLSALVIIRLTGIRRYKDRETACFSEIELPLSDLDGYEEKPFTPHSVDITEYHNSPVPETDMNFSSYPALSELAGIYAAGTQSTEVTPALALEWLQSTDRSDTLRLMYMLSYLAKRSPDRALDIAAAVAPHLPASDQYRHLIRTVYRTIVNNPSEASEKLVTDYLIEHSRSDPAWDICLSYPF